MAVRRPAEGDVRFEAAFHSSPTGMLISDETAKILHVNEAFASLLGRSRESLLGASCTDLTHPDDVAGSLERRARVLAGVPQQAAEKRYVHADGTEVWVEVSISRFPSAAKSVLMLVHVTDIAAHRAALQQLAHQATHDELTGLPNRSLLTDRTAHALRRRARHNSDVALLSLDLDGFRHVNETMGHAVGDRVLREAGARLLRALRPSDTVARLGEDEFAVLLEDLDTRQEADGVAKRLGAALAEPYVIGDNELVTTASIGIAFAEDLHQEPEDLLRDATTAMHRAKTDGRDRVDVYDMDLRRSTQQRGVAERTLRAALRDEAVVVHYQPVVDLGSGRTVAVEALARLRGRDGALVPPIDFIGVAEETGLIVELGTTVLRTACEQTSTWRRVLGLDIAVAVNLSARQAARADLARTVLDVLEQSELPSTALSLELTETALLEATADTLQQLELLRSAGIEIGIDDFGTGYASLRYLASLPVSFVKIDRSFTSGLPHDPTALVIVDAVARLASDLGLRCVAEGVETTEQSQWYGRYPGMMVQGYLHGRPVDADHVLPYLSVH